MISCFIIVILKHIPSLVACVPIRVSGIIKFSCTVLGPGDIQKVHDPVNPDDEAEKVLIVLYLFCFCVVNTIKRKLHI